MPRAVDVAAPTPPSAVPDANDPFAPVRDGARTTPAANRVALAPVALVDELARAGVRDACIAPGSRSAPLASALIAHGGIRLWSHVDERSGAFFALGLARASRRPVAVVCTSGTAVANLLPAVVEAFHARLPLLLLTADRPPELRDCGAGQAIDQLGIFGTHVRWFFELGTPEASSAALRHVRATACRAVAVACGDTGAPPGPVHLNVPLREPLDPRPEPDAVAAVAGTRAARGRDGVAWTRTGRARPVPVPEVLEEIAALLRASGRPLVVAGPLDDADPAVVPAVAGLCAALRAPLFADVASNLRREEMLPFLVDAHDAVVRARPFAAASHDPASPLRPDAIVRLAGTPTSKALTTWLAALDDVPQIVVDPAATWADPASLASHVVTGAPAPVCSSIAARLGAPHATRGPAPVARAAREEWLARWRDAGRRARRACGAALAQVVERHGRGGADEGVPPFEGHAVLALSRALPDGAALYVGNSLAVRAVDAFWPAGAPALRVLANRGANGIDGFVSSVLGAAAALDAGGAPAPVVGLCGDLTFYHDLNGLLAARRYGVRAVFVVLDNDGGGIFDHLPIARHRAGYEEHFATPHGLDFAPLVAAYGCDFERIERVSDLDGALARALAAPRTAVVALRIDRARSLAAWNAVRARAVAAAEEDGDAPACDGAGEAGA